MRVTTGLNSVIYLVNVHIDVINVTVGQTCMLIATLLIFAIITLVQVDAKIYQNVHSLATKSTKIIKNRS